MGKISFFGFNYVPVNYMACEGQLIAISENQALYSLLGSRFGGDGRVSFGMPDLRGRVVIGAGEGPQLSNFNMGSRGGSQSTTLTINNLPAHTHSLEVKVSDVEATSTQAVGRENSLAIGGDNMYANSTPSVALDIGENSTEVGKTGSGQPFNNIPPYLVLNACVLVQGLWPSRQ